MEITYYSDHVHIKNLIEFDPKDIFTCGQCFRFYEEDDESFTIVAYGKVLNIKKEEDDIYIIGSNEEDFKNIWYKYFDLEKDYKKIEKALSIDPVMKKAISYGKGIRILNQEKFETIISFIISANNGISRIRKSIEKISNLYGNYITEDKNRIYYSFPSPSVLKDIDPLEIREKTKVGFRDKRIVESSKMIYNKDINIEEISKLSLQAQREELMKLPGVGPKVADCILLFSFERNESFPVDVWIKRVMEELYIKEEIQKKEVAQKGREIFGSYAGFANQYLFYYGRENKIGVKKW